MSRAPRRFGAPANAGPQAAWLSNGRYATVITDAGGGASRWGDRLVTRFRQDGVCDPGTQFIYMRDASTAETWSATHQPTCHASTEYSASFLPERARIAQQHARMGSVLEVTVDPDDDIELRTLELENLEGTPRTLEVTSFVELSLANAGDDLAHPVFAKLFLETEWHAELGALLCGRRPRDASDPGEWAVHVLSTELQPAAPLQYETDRVLFIGRGGDASAPLGMDGRALSGTVGQVLDPSASIRLVVELPARGRVRLAFSTGVARTRDEALALARRYRNLAEVTRSFERATAAQARKQAQLNISDEDVQTFEALASALFYTDRSLARSAEAMARNELGQSGLWPHGISGDVPILLARVRGAQGAALVQQLVLARRYFQSKRLRADVVVIDTTAGIEAPELAAAMRSAADTIATDRTTCVLLPTAAATPASRTLFEAVASVTLDDLRPLAAQLARSAPAPQWPAALTAGPANAGARPPHTAELKVPTLRHFNGTGGFSEDGRQYVVVLQGNQHTPMPWANVLANPEFGSVVTAAGPSFTWAENSRENRLTPFTNDPVTETAGEAIYLRDDESGAIWGASPGPLPRSADEPRWLIRHGMGVTRYQHARAGLQQELALFAHASAPLRFALLTLRNDSDRPRTLSVFAYNEWALCPPRAGEQLHVVTEFDAHAGAILARNPYNREFASRVAFAHAGSLRSATGDRHEFIGRNRSLARPAALSRQQLGGRFGAGLSACAALQSTITLGAGEARQLVLLLGQAQSRDHALQLIARYGTPEAAQAALVQVETQLQKVLCAVQVRTPDSAFDLIMNGWLLYQSLASRLWARTGFYQPGGAYGYRDQIQDVMALTLCAPELLREHLLRASSRQFVEGDVQHWWHAHTGVGIRSKCSDDMLWLPFAIAHYVTATGDAAILDAVTPYLEGNLLGAHEHERYEVPNVSKKTGSVYEHCVRAIERGLTRGAHGLPLMGSCDWNDGMNRVGIEGRGESVWLAWFLIKVLGDFAKVADSRNDHERAKHYRAEATRLAAAVEQAWDGDWYRRAYFDDGTPLGSAQNQHCRIDSISQSWGMLSGAAPEARIERAFDSVRTHLVRRDASLVQLLEPAFDRCDADPGYIQGYPPGIRENGGQYTHAALWFVMAVAERGGGDEASELFAMINPINHARDASELDRYKVEPYVVAADVYTNPAHVGRGGWTWYTASAAWMYRAGLESILGIERRGAYLRIHPSIPKGWPSFAVELQHGSAHYQVSVDNTARKGRGIQRIELDGIPAEGNEIPFRDDGSRHLVRVTLG